jgi:NADH-quinone oxidoreductase subunit M
MFLLSLVIIPLAFALAVALAPRKHAYPIALLGTLVPIGFFAVLASRFHWESGSIDQFGARFEWLPDLGLSLTVGVDGVSMLLLGLTVLLGPICVGASLTAITKRVKTYYFWLLVLQAAMSGVFLARDVILFYIFFEFTLIPMFVLISLFGSSNRKAAAIKFFLYTFTGSVLALAGLVFLAWHHASTAGAGGGGWTFEFDKLRNSAQALPLETQRWVFLALMAGFAVKVPLFPLHTWLPLAHTEAPTAGSVILAGVLLKLGTYGILVFAVPLAPEAALDLAVPIGVLSIIGIVVAGLICWVQTDVKKLVAYSSVAHLGFCVLGLFAFNAAGLQGSILYMINHGLSTGALFLCIGMIYERYHTRSMKELGGLAYRMPIWATFMVFFTMASVGLPGTNGFISEFLCLLGAFQAYSGWSTLAPGSVGGTGGSFGPYMVAIAGTGMIVAAIYLLYMVGRVCFGPVVEPAGHGHHGHGHGGDSHGAEHAVHLPTDLTGREIAILLPLAALCLGLGLYPKPALSALEPSVLKTAAMMDRARERMSGVGEAAGAAAPASPSAEQETPASGAATEAQP